MEEQQQLFIPKKIKVGYQKRDDTYTNRLAYVIYFDNKGVLRKEASWEGWRHKNIEPNEFENVPTEGFVLNKGVGGQRQSYGWDARNEYIRVYDPRNFEFEISVANLLYILQECTSTKGKGLEGEFVYSWEGKELVLLPVGSGAYKNSTDFTDLQSGKVSTKELITGAIYVDKRQNELIFLGRFPWYELEQAIQYNRKTDKLPNYDYYHEIIKDTKMFIFADKNGEIKPLKNISSLSKCIDSTPVANYSDLMETYNKTIIFSSRPVGLTTKPKKFVMQESNWHPYLVNDDAFVSIGDNKFVKVDVKVNYTFNYERSKNIFNHFYPEYRGKMVQITSEGKLETSSYDVSQNVNPVQYKNIEDLTNSNLVELFVILENGSEIPFLNYNHTFKYVNSRPEFSKTIV